MTGRWAALTIGVAIAAGGLLVGCGPSDGATGGPTRVPVTPSSKAPTSNSFQQPCLASEGDIKTESGTCLYYDPSLTPTPGK